MPAQIFGAQAAVTALNRAFANTSPGNGVFSNQVANATASLPAGSDSTQALSYTGFAKTFGAAYASQSASALSTLMLTNMGLLPNAALTTALTEYITSVGTGNVGIVALQLSTILSGLEGDTTYGAAATAWNNEVTTAFTYSSNTANANSSSGDAAANAGQTFTLTTSTNTTTGGVDNVTGTAANDLITGIIDIKTASNTSFNTSDLINGADGTDTLSVTLSGGDTSYTATGTGAVTTTTTVTAGSVSNVETLNIVNATNNFSSVASTGTAAVTTLTQLTEINTTAVKGLTTVNVQSSNADLSVAGSFTTGGNTTNATTTANTTTKVSNLAGIVNASMKNGAGSLELVHTTTAVAGTADALTLTLDNQTGGSFTVNGIETLTVSGTTKSSLNKITDAAAKTLNVTGAGAVTIKDLDATNNTVLTTVDASTSTGGVTLGATATSVNDAITKVLGGTGNDTVILTASQVASTDTIDGGTGSDTVNLLGGNLGTAHAVIKGFEVLAISDTGSSYDLSKLTGSTIEKVSISSTGGNATVSKMTNQSVTLSGDAPGTVSLGFTTADSSVTVTLDNGTGKNADGVDVTTLTATNVKNLTIASNDTNNSLTGTNSNSAGAIQVENVTVDASAATSLVFTGTKTKVINGATSTGKLTIDAASAFADTTTKAGVSVTTGSGADVITTTAQNDTIVAGAGNDTVNLGDGKDNIDLGAGNDKLVVAGADWAKLTADDTVAGGDGTDTLSITAANTGSYSLSGANSAKLSNATSIEKIELDISALTTGQSATLSVDDATVSVAGNALTVAVKPATSVVADAVAIVNAGSVVLSNGTVTLDATGFGSILKYTGGNAKEAITGGTQADVFTYATTAYLSGTDTIVGGDGADVLVFSESAADKAITAAQLAGVSNVGTINLDGASGANSNKASLTLSAAVATAMAESGVLTIKSDDAGTTPAVDDTGAQTINGSAVGTDVKLMITGALGNDTITGGAANDTITSLKGNDTVDLSAGGVDTVQFLLMTESGGGFDTVKSFTQVGTGTTAAVGSDVISFAIANQTAGADKNKVFTTNTTTFGFAFANVGNGNDATAGLIAGESIALNTSDFNAVTTGTTLTASKVNVISSQAMSMTGGTTGLDLLGTSDTNAAIVVYYSNLTQRVEVGYLASAATNTETLTVIGVVDGKSLADLAGFTAANFGVYGV